VGKFETGNIQSETFPSYRNRRWYSGWESWQPVRADFTPVALFKFFASSSYMFRAVHRVMVKVQFTL